MIKLYGIVGYPLKHSLSPMMQNAAFSASRIDAHYVALSIEPERIRRALAGLKHSGFFGFNVTVPYKETVPPFLDGVSPAARSVGAVNTIVANPKTGRWVGHNTDVYGFQKSLERAKISAAGSRVLLLGAGGAARAVCAAILPKVRSMTVWNRTARRAGRLRAAFPASLGKKMTIARHATDIDKGGSYDLIINSTSVGLHRGDRLTLPRGVFDGARAAVDLIYNPAETRFLRDARAAGCRIANGIDMLLYQGARAFELWTRRPAPVAAMRRALYSAKLSAAQRFQGEAE